MRVFLDNLDGQGYLEYTRWVAMKSPLTIERALNRPSVCSMGLYLQAANLSAPAVRARVAVLADNGTALFTGYVMSVTPKSDAADAWTAVLAESDEAVANVAGAALGLDIVQGTLADEMQRLAQQQGAGMMDASAVVATQQVCLTQRDGDRTFSENARTLAEASYAAYRVLSGAVGVQAIGETTHTFTDVVLTTWNKERASANDITVSGEIEPATYVTEIFTADGTTAAFALAEAPFHADEPVVVDDVFRGAEVDAHAWEMADPVSSISIGGAGLVMNGGDGVDGDTRLVAADAVELGGSLLAETSGVLLDGACDGVVNGFFDGDYTVAHCLAGIRIRQSSGVTVAFALVNGVETGSAFLVESGHRYTFRVRLHADEVHRVQQTYRATVNGAVTSFGGDVVPSTLRVVCDVQDLGLASNTAATVLCDAVIVSAPTAARYAAFSGAQMFGSIRRVRLLRGPGAWLRLRDTENVERAALIGQSGEGIDASLSSTGTLTFFEGRVPGAGETIVVNYRTSARAVARVEDADAIATGDATGIPGRVQLRVRVRSPWTRNSADCVQAAAALLAVAGDAASRWNGVCTVIHPHLSADVWPGDAVVLPAAPSGIRILVRGVTIRDTNSVPEALVYELELANEWAEELAIRTTQGLSDDAPVPVTTETASNAPIENLNALSVIAVSESAIQVDAGVDAPAGGGFEVRRGDAGFGATSGTDADLVLRSPVRGFDIPRAAQQEIYYVRMYDGSSPRRYSRFSSAVRVTVPMG